MYQVQRYNILKIIKNKSTEIKYKKISNKYLQCHVFALNYIKYNVSNKICNKNFRVKGKKN